MMRRRSVLVLLTVMLTFAAADGNAATAELGYGDGDEATVVGCGPSSTSKYINTDFRHTYDSILDGTATPLGGSGASNGDDLLSQTYTIDQKLSARMSAFAAE